MPDVAVAMTFTDDPLMSKTTRIRRQYLDLARSMLGLPPVTYRLTPLSGRILANDIEELRAGVR